MENFDLYLQIEGVDQNEEKEDIVDTLYQYRRLLSEAKETE